MRCEPALIVGAQLAVGHKPGTFWASKDIEIAP